MDDMRCAVCDADVYGLDVRSVSVIEWDPDGNGNVLLAVLCKDPRCLRDWAINRIPTEWPLRTE